MKEARVYLSAKHVFCPSDHTAGALLNTWSRSNISILLIGIEWCMSVNPSVREGTDKTWFFMDLLVQKGKQMNK